MKRIINTHFIDHTDEMKAYKPGDDVSHISEAQLAFLETKGHIEKVIKEEPKHAKKGK